MVIDNEFVYDCPVDILRRKFILVAFFDHLSHLCEVPRDGRSVLTNYQVVMENNVLQKLSVTR
jgi:hypothetical protein